MSFKGEGTGHHADRERAAFLGNLRDNWRRACACAAAHTRGDEDHIRAFQHVIQFVCGFLGGLAPDLRVAARAQTAGELVTESARVVGAFASIRACASVFTAINSTP